MTLSDYQRPEINSANGQLLRQFSLGERFQRIFQRNLWHGTESISGPGSSQTETAVIRRELPLLLQRLGSQVLLDAPCGDAFWISRCGLPLTYIGVDIVPDLIADLSNKVSSGALTGRFLVADITHTPLPEADTILCRDCLVHLSFQNISNPPCQ